MHHRRMEPYLKTIRTKAVEETIALGRIIGMSAQEGSVIAFKGGLGAGKTTLCKGIALGLGIEETKIGRASCRERV